MKIPRHLDRSASSETQTMTPMIDVVFLLLVFFVCASVGRTPDLLLPAKLGAGNTATAEASKSPGDTDEWESPEVRVKLSVGAPNDSGTAKPSGSSELIVEMNSRHLKGIDDLRKRLERLSAVNSDAQIILDVADSVPVTHFIAVYDFCQKLKFGRIAFAARAGD
jgi:biopolymer transport protein ExbD